MKERKKRECKPVDTKVRGEDFSSIVIAAPEILSRFHANDNFLYLNLTYIYIERGREIDFIIMNAYQWLYMFKELFALSMLYKGANTLSHTLG